MTKDFAYYLGYWLAALLPVIAGFGVTLLIIWILQKNYKGDEEDKTD